MTHDEIQSEIKNYVRVLETNYNDKIVELRRKLEQEKKKVTQEKTKSVTNTIEKNDLEQLFVRCVEEVRKDIIKRRLKAEVNARKKVGGG